MGRLRIEEPQFKPPDPPAWEARYIAALDAYGKARDANNRATYGKDGLPARVEAGHAEWNAMQAVDMAASQAANDFLFGLRMAAELHAEDLLRLLLIVLGEPIADAVMEGAR